MYRWYAVKDKKPFFILAGNGPYNNRGCEAIVRGTLEILRHYFDDPQFMAVSHYDSSLQFEQQKRSELDEAINHKRAIRSSKRFEPFSVWFLQTSLRFLYPKGNGYFFYQKMLPYLKEAVAVLSIGGDNYSLDYGKPTAVIDLDNLVLAKKKPIIIWGASVGPFDRIPQYEKYMGEHLKKITAIFARETATIEYLAKIGVTENVYRMADPAFLLKPVRPPKERFDRDIPKEAIGLNLSPLMAGFATSGNLKEWIDRAIMIIRHISDQIKRPLFLIYHVTVARSNDYEFLKNVLALAGERKGMIQLIPDGLNASELKWVIGKLSAFAGARTHATIAAISSSVPTLSFAYSIKAKGINKDIFGHENYCLDPYQLSPEIIVEKLGELIQNAEEIKKKITLVLPEVKNLAMRGGRHLKEIIDGNIDKLLIAEESAILSRKC